MFQCMCIRAASAADSMSDPPMPRPNNKWGKSARRRKNAALKCECLGWWFPHRIGSRSADTTNYGCAVVSPRDTADKRIAHGIQSSQVM